MRSVTVSTSSMMTRQIDAGAAVAFLTTEAYWGQWRDEADIRRQIGTAWRLVGAYDRAGAMVASPGVQRRRQCLPRRRVRAARPPRTGLGKAILGR